MEPLLGNLHEANNETKPAVRQQILKKQKLNYKEWGTEFSAVGPNNSTVALRVVGGDEKRTQCLEV
jgi:hypothetical protein